MMMESPSRTLTLGPTPTPTHTRSSSLRRRRRSSSESANSPEFEFWRLGPTIPQPELHSADQLFSDGFLLPLHLLHLDNHPDPDTQPDPEPQAGPAQEDSESNQPNVSASITSSNPILTASKRWREIIFKRGGADNNKKPTSNPDEVTSSKRDKSIKKRDKKIAGNNGSGNNNPAELNINIWPFSRSRSAGNGSGGARPGGSGRKVSSAPCSRSNSSGESKSRRSWPNSPGRTGVGVHIGRTSPVWQLHRRNRPDVKPAVGVKGRVLNFNVPMCMGYRQQMSCRSDGVGDGGGGGRGGGGGGVGVGVGGGGSGTNGNLFGLRGLFSKKSVLTV